MGFGILIKSEVIWFVGDVCATNKKEPFQNVSPWTCSKAHTNTGLWLTFCLTRFSLFKESLKVLPPTRTNSASMNANLAHRCCLPMVDWLKKTARISTSTVQPCRYVVGQTWFGPILISPGQVFQGRAEGDLTLHLSGETVETAATEEV